MGKSLIANLKSKIKNRLPKIRLQTRLLLLTALGLVPIFSFIAWEGIKAVDTAIQMTLQERLALARMVAMHLDQSLERALDRLAHVAASPAVNMEDGDMKPEKAELQDLYRAELFSYVFLLNKEGLVLWSDPYLPQVVGRQRLECFQVKEALRTGEPGIAYLAHSLTPQKPMVAPVVPVRNRKGAVVGLLGAAIDTSSPSFTHVLQRVPPGKTGYAQLVDENGLVLAHTKGRNLFQKSEHADFFVSLIHERSAAVSTQMASEEGNGSGREVIAFALLSQAPWGVAVGQAEVEVLAPALDLRRRMSIFAILTLATTLLLVWVAARSVIEPVRKLVAASGRIAAGDLATQIPPLGGDEIGELGRRFEEMRERLARWGEELETAVQKRTRELSILYTIDRATTQSLNLEEILNEVMKALDPLQVEVGSIYLLEPDGETMTLRGHRGLSDEFVRNVKRVRLDEGIFGGVVVEKRPIALDLLNYPTERFAPFIAQEDLKTLVSTPLLSAGELVGVLNLATRRPRAYPPEELKLLAAIGQQLGGAVRNAGLYEETQLKSERLAVINRLDRVISASLEIKEVYQTFVEEAAKLISFDRMAIVLLDEAREHWEVVALWTRTEPYLRAGARAPVKGTLMERLLIDRQPLIEGELGEKGEWPENGMLRREGMRSRVLLPLIAKGQMQGLQIFASHQPYTYSVRDLEVLLPIADQMAIAIENSRLYAQTQQSLARVTQLYELSSEILATTRVEETATMITHKMVQATGAHSAMINLIDAAGQITIRIGADAQGPLPPEPPPRPTGVTMTIFRTGQPAIATGLDDRSTLINPRLVKMGIKAFIGLPLKVGTRVTGVLFLRYIEPHLFPADEIQAFTTYANQAAMALEKARLYEETQRHMDELSSLREAAVAVTSELELPRVLNRIVEEAAFSLGFPFSAIFLLDEVSSLLYLQAAHGLSEQFRQEMHPVPLGLGLVGRAAGERQSVVSEDSENDPRMQALPHNLRVSLEEGIRSVLAVPMLVRGKVVGTLSIYGRTPQTFAEEQIHLLSTFADQAAISIENARLYEAEQRLAEENAIVAEIGRIISSTLNIDEVYERFAEEVRKLIPFNRLVIIINNPEESTITIAYVAGADVSGPQAGDLFSLAGSLHETILGTRSSLLIQTEDMDELAGRFPGLLTTFLAGLRSMMSIPLISRDEVIGVLHFQSPKPKAYTDMDLKLAERIGAQIAGAIASAQLFTERKQAEEEIQRRMAELSALFEVSSALRGAATVEEMLSIIMDKTLKVLRADAGNIYLLDKAKGDLVCGVASERLKGLYSIRLQPGEGITGYVMETGQPYVSSDLLGDPRFPPRPELQAIFQGLHSNVCVPLKTTEAVIGAMHINSLTPRTFTENEVRLLVAIADMASSAIHRAGLFEELQHLVTELATLYDVSKMVAATLRIEDVLDFIVTAASKTLHAEASYLFLWHDQEERLVLRASKGFLLEDVGHKKYRLGEGLAGWVFLEGKAVNVLDTAKDPRWKPESVEARLPSGRAISALVVPLALGAKTRGVLGVINKVGAPAFTAGDESLLTTLAGQMAIALENARLYEDVRGLSVATIRSLATAIDARDPYTKGHSEEVARLSLLLARKLGWDGADLEMLEFTALLHDVGKIAVPDAILRKPGPLIPGEWNVIHLHPYHSAQIVKPVEPLRRIVNWIYHHQERWDGMGYPDGLKGEEIPPAARIIAVADAFNAMTTDRPYHAAKTREEAIEEVRRSAGTQFDPQVVEAFTRILDL